MSNLWTIGGSTNPAGSLEEIMRTMASVSEEAIRSIVTDGAANRHTLMCCGKRVGNPDSNSARLPFLGRGGDLSYGNIQILFQSSRNKYDGYNSCLHRWAPNDAIFQEHLEFGPPFQRPFGKPSWMRDPPIGCWRWQKGTSDEQIYCPAPDFLPIGVLVQARDIPRLREGFRRAVLEVNTYGHRVARERHQDLAHR